MAEENIHRTNVKIFGEEYTLKSSTDPEYMEKVANVVDETMNRIADAKPKLSIHQIAVLAALNLADEYMKLDKEYSDLMEMLDNDGDSAKG